MIYRLLEEQKSAVKFFISLLIFCLLYRIIFFATTCAICNDPIIVQSSIIAFGLLSDLIACIAFTLLVYIPLNLFAYFFAKKMPRFMHVLFITIPFLFFLLFVFIYITNLKTFSNLYIGISYTLIAAYYYQGMTSFALLSLINSTDILILLAAITIYLLINWISIKRAKKFSLYFLLPLYSFLTVYGAVVFLNCHFYCLSDRLLVMYRSPINHIFCSFLQTFNKYNNNNFTISQNQRRSVKLIDPTFTTPETPCITLHNSQKKSWNIVIFVLESVSSKYIFEPVNNTIPMPFLKWLSTQGTWFENTYTSGNISALGQFSILTGIYPNPTPTHFEMQNNLYIPTIATWLGKSYDSFFVTASNNLYASKSMYRTFSEYDNADVIHPKIKNLFFNMFMDENEAFNFFKQRLNRAKVPFVGLYWSGATHYPYNDYHFQNPILTNINNPYVRYINNLSLLDQEIKQTYELLRKKKLLESTIFIIIGDHGELFGQHSNLQAHGRSLYSEEVKVPLLIYAPKLIKPQVVHELTSSIDILPTLLDGLNIDYGDQIQGQSYFRHSSNRKYIFIYGDEDEISAINSQNMKMNISFSEDTCTAYDLNNDPNEKNPLACTDTKQQEAILKFRHHQPNILHWYNHLCNTKQVCS